MEGRERLEMRRRSDRDWRLEDDYRSNDDDDPFDCVADSVCDGVDAAKCKKGNLYAW